MDKPKIDIKTKSDPLTASLSKYLKDPANYHDIMRQVIASVQSTCTHSDVFEMAKCKKCTENMLNRRKLLKKLGFKNPRQFMVWRRTHEEIIKRFPLVDWERNKFIS
jgi:hypothetical protein